MSEHVLSCQGSAEGLETRTRERPHGSDARWDWPEPEWSCFSPGIRKPCRVRRRGPVIPTSSPVSSRQRVHGGAALSFPAARALPEALTARPLLRLCASPLSLGGLQHLGPGPQGQGRPTLTLSSDSLSMVTLASSRWLLRATISWLSALFSSS